MGNPQEDLDRLNVWFGPPPDLVSPIPTRVPSVGPKGDLDICRLHPGLANNQKQSAFHFDTWSFVSSTDIPHTDDQTLPCALFDKATKTRLNFSSKF